MVYPFRILATLILLILLPTTLCAQERGGILPNGLGYIIRQNQNPKQKVELRLIYKIGSLVESENERGYAHFLEHLAFSGTTHFPNRSLVDFVESRGSRYGIGLNAMTGYDRTIYMMSLPLERSSQYGTIDSALLILHDWLHGIQLDSLSVERERGIIQGEIRSFVEQDPFYSLKIGRGLEQSRLPIADLRAVDSVSYQRLQKFYHRWYRPSLATILVVGDVDPIYIENRLRSLFATDPNASTERPPLRPLIYKRGINIHQLADTLEQSVTLDLITPLKALHSSTPKLVAYQALWRIATQALSNRLSPWTQGQIRRTWYLGDTDHLNITLTAPSKSIALERLSLSFSHLKSLATFGIGSSEFAQLRAELLRDYPILQDQSSEAWCNYYTDHLLMGDLLITDEEMQTEVLQAIKQLRTTDLKPLFRQILRAFRQTSLVAYTFNPHRQGHEKLTAKEIRKMIHRGLKRTAPAYQFQSKVLEAEVEPKLPTPTLLNRLPLRNEGGEIISSYHYTNLGVDRYQFANGIQILLKPMPGVEGVKVSLLTLGGYASIPIGEESLLEGVAGYMEMGLIDGISTDSLQQYMYTNGLSFSLIPSPYHYGFMASAPKEELRPLLNLIRLKMIQPERPYADFEDIRRELYTKLGKAPSLLTQRLERNPNQRMERIIDSLMLGSIYLPEPQDSITISQLNLDRLAQFHQELLRGTEGMTIIISGNFDPIPTLSWLQDIFGSLPKQSPLPIIRSGQISSLPKQLSLEDNPQEGESTTLYHLAYGTYTKGLRGSLTLKLMRELLRNRMIKYLRTESGLIYTPYLSVFYRAFPIPQAYFVLETSTSPTKRLEVERKMQSLITELQQQLVGEQELEDIRRTFLVNKREALTDSNLGAWQTALIDIVKYEEGLEQFDRYEEVLRSISSAEICKAFQDFFKPNNIRIYYIGKTE